MCFKVSVHFSLCSFFTVLYFVFQTALKGEEEPQASKKNFPGKKRKNNKKNQSRKRMNAPPDKEVRNRNIDQHHGHRLYIGLYILQYRVPVASVKSAPLVYPLSHNS